VNTKDSPTKQVRQDAILGGMPIGQLRITATALEKALVTVV